MYAVLRSDLEMNAGKAASQAGHAFVESYDVAPINLKQSYNTEDGGTKIVLTCASEAQLCDLFFKAKKANLPCSMVVEKDHIMPPCFDGSPIATAIGIGPVYRSQAKCITKGLQLLK